MEERADRHMNPKLTQRQQGVVAGLVRGLTREQIAVELGVEPTTVQIHIGQVMHRWNCATDAEIVAKAAGGG